MPGGISMSGLAGGAASGAMTGSVAGPIGTMAGGVLGAGMSLLGGLMGSDNQKKLTKMNIDLQRDFAQHGIQWKVDDARRAGIHPAAALGAFPVSANPIILEDPMGKAIADAGQDISGAVSRTLNTEQRLAHRLNNDLTLAQIRETDARTGAIHSDTMRKAMESGVPFPSLVNEDGTGQTPNVPSPGLPTGNYKVDVPTRLNSKTGDPSGEPGTSPSWEMVQYPGFKMKMPSGRGQESPQEIFSELPLYEQWGWIMHNAQTQGRGWLDKYVDFMLTGSTMQERFKGTPPILPMNDTEKALRRSLDKGLGAARRYGNKTWKDIMKGR